MKAIDLKTNTGEISLLYFPQIVAQPLMWLMLITIAIGMCLMNGYLIVKGHAHSPHKRGKQAESFRASPPVSSLNDDCSTTYSRIFFNLFSSTLVSAGSLPNSAFLFPRFATFLAPDGNLVDFP